MNVNKKTMFTVARMTILACGAFALSACGGGQGGMKLGDDEFTVVTVNATNSEQTTQYPATIRGLQDVEVRPQVSGLITRLLVDEGATVRRGQALFSIDATQYQAAVQQAQAAVQSAQASLKTATDTEANKKMLHAQNIISDFEYQAAQNNLSAAKAAYAQAQAQLVSAKQNLSFCTVTSPSDGVVGTFPYRVGSLVGPSIASPLTTVSQIGDVYAYFSLSERELLAMTKSGKSLKEQLSAMPSVRLQLSDGSFYAHEGRIDAVSGVINQNTGSVSMRAIFRNPENVLRSGGTGNVVFPYTMNDVIEIPQTATQEIQDKKFVFVLQKDSTVKYTEIQVADLNDGKSYVVTGGLKVGDKVVIEGVQILKDGQTIKAITPEQRKAKYDKALKDQKEGNIQTAFQ